MISRPSTFGLLLAWMMLSILANPLAAQDDNDIPVLITADTITYDTAAETVTAEGDVELTREGERLLADRITYNQATDRVIASGNIVLLGAQGDTVFADELELDGALRDGFADGAAVLFEDNSRLAGVRALRREGNLTIMQNAVYSPCELCEDDEGPPIWQIRAETVIHDQDARTITYYNPVFEFFGVPIAYSPYFEHPDPSVERKSGFLIPTFGSSSELGFTVETPYFIDLGPSQDFTFEPIFTTGAGAVLGGEFRDLTKIGVDRSGKDRVADTVISGSFTYTDAYSSDPEENRGEEFRGNIRADGEYDLDNDYDTGFELDLASDNTYLERYGFDNTNVLT
ncbi:MAG: LptA/OstA family protein, partial [Pseudomonadota bacterium]